MKANNFWGTSRSSGISTGMIVRIGLALVALVGSLTLAWALLSSHSNVHASGVNPLSTTANPWAITFDKAGNAWVAEPGCEPLNCPPPFPKGVIQEFNISGGKPSPLQTYPATNTYMPRFLAVDGSGNVWFTDTGNNAIGELTISGNTWTEFTTGISPNANPMGMVLDKNGNLWFAEAGTNKIGFFNTTSHAVVETAVPTANSQPWGLTYDSVHDVVWFAENNAAKIGTFTVTANGTITITDQSIGNGPFPHMITIDSGGNLWYSLGGADKIGEFITSTKTPKTFSVAGGICPTPAATPTTCSNTNVYGVAVDSTGTVWFDENQNGLLGSLNPTSGAVNIFNLGMGTGPWDGLGVDPSNNVWVTEYWGKQVGELAAGSAPTPTPTTGGGSPSPSPTTPTTTPTPPPIVPGPVSPTWYFAEGKVGQGFTEFLTIQNPDPVNACSVSIQYLLSTSTPAPRLLTVAPNTRFTESVNSDLGTPASSTSYKAVSTIVTVTNTPTCKGVVAERPIYFTNFKGISSGTDVLGATHTGTNFYFADVSSLPGYNSYITILNPPGVTAASITATYSLGGNVLGTDTLTVAAGTRGTIIPKNFGQRVATWVHSSAAVVVERPTYFNNYSSGNAHNVYGSASVVGAPAPANDWRFAEGYTGGQFQENLVLSNFGTTAATGTLVLEYDNGSTLTNSITVPAQGVSIIDVNNYTINKVGTCAPMPCVLSQSVSAEITMSTGAIVAEREMFFHYSHFDRLTGRTVNSQGGTDVTGQSGAAAATSYSFAEGYTNAGFDEWLTVQNPTANPETVWVTLVNGKSNTYSFSMTVGGHSRATVNIVDVVVQHLYHPNDGVGGYEVSMTVQTTGGSVFVAERPMYWKAIGTQGGDDVIGYTGG